MGNTLTSKGQVPAARPRGVDSRVKGRPCTRGYGRVGVYVEAYVALVVEGQATIIASVVGVDDIAPPDSLDGLEQNLKRHAWIQVWANVQIDARKLAQAGRGVEVEAVAKSGIRDKADVSDIGMVAVTTKINPGIIGNAHASIQPEDELI